MTLLRRLHIFVWSAVGGPLEAFKLWIIKKHCIGHVDGIAICDVSGVQPSNVRFMKATQEAMTLIQTLDPRRYRRLCRHVAYIVNAPLISGGDFETKYKICNVDHSRYIAMDDPQRSLRWYACLLVHESTHGVIGEKGILYDQENRVRIEKLCHQEEYRFALRLEPGWADANIRPFNPERWKLYWGPWRNRMAAHWSRLQKQIRALSNQPK